MIMFSYVKFSIANVMYIVGYMSKKMLLGDEKNRSCNKFRIL